MNVLELRHLRYFVAVAEELHFGRAAQRLHMAQPPLSQQIRSLEREVGVPLLERTHRRVRLTAAGAAFYDEARSILDHVKLAVQLAQRAGHGEIGRLAIGFVGSAMYGLLPDIVRVYRSRYPDVELSLTEAPTVEQVTAIREGRIDVGFVRTSVTDSALRCETLLAEPLVVALPQDHARAGAPSVALRHLAEEPFVIFPRQLGHGFYDVILAACLQAGFQPRIVQEAIQMQTIVSLVAAGIGIALVPQSMENAARRGVAYVALDAPAPEVELAAVWRCDDSSPALHNFLEVAYTLARPTQQRP
jgi:DNA-binding transcriptional LysR family regulator